MDSQDGERITESDDKSPGKPGDVIEEEAEVGCGQGTDQSERFRCVKIERRLTLFSVWTVMCSLMYFRVTDISLNVSTVIPLLPAFQLLMSFLSLLPIRAPVEEERCQVELLTFQQRLPCPPFWVDYGITSLIRDLGLRPACSSWRTRSQTRTNRLQLQGSAMLSGETARR